MCSNIRDEALRDWPAPDALIRLGPEYSPSRRYARTTVLHLLQIVRLSLALSAWMVYCKYRASTPLILDPKRDWLSHRVDRRPSIGTSLTTASLAPPPRSPALCSPLRVYIRQLRIPYTAPRADAAPTRRVSPVKSTRAAPRRSTVSCPHRHAHLDLHPPRFRLRLHLVLRLSRWGYRVRSQHLEKNGLPDRSCPERGREIPPRKLAMQAWSVGHGSSG